MKKIKEKNFLYNFISETIFALIFFPLFDMLFDKKEFVYSVNDHIIGPIMFGFFYAVFTFIFNKNNKNK